MHAYHSLLQRESCMSLPPKIKPSSIVNAYLFYAQRLLQFQKMTPHIVDTDADTLAFSAGISLCLKQAWQAWLDELGRYLNKSLRDYTDLLLPDHRELTEVAILLNLAHESDSWLAQLLSCFDPWIKTSQIEVPERGQIQAGRIDVVQVDAGKTVLKRPETPEQFAHLISAFKAYIQLVRHRQEEW
jgi:hypothetical protein